MCPTQDNGFLIVGKTKRKDNGALTYENSYDAFMLKIDSLGQEVWYKTFGRNLSENDEDEFYKVVQTPDKGYLCAGYTKSWQTGNVFTDLGDWWLVKTDSMGVEQWSRRYGHPDYNDGRPYGLIMSSDTSYYVIGAETEFLIGSNVMLKSKILKLDKDFNDVYEKSFGRINTVNFFLTIIENNEGDLLLNSYYRFYDDMEVYGTVGRLYKLNADGDSIWRRQYTCLDTTNSINYPFSIKQTTDGGYIFTGIAYDAELSPAQQVWLVKTDEYGCDGTEEFWPCDTNVGINEYVSNPSFSFYPNPTRDNLFITCHFDRSGEISSQTVEIYDLTGKIVKQASLRATKQSNASRDYFTNVRNDEIRIQISDLEKGVYIVRVGKQTKKLIVE